MTLAKLRSFVGERPNPAGEHCELCGASVPHEHSHLVNVETRQLLCSCRPCYLLFTSQGAGKLRAVPERTLRLNEFALSPEQWDRMQIPVGVVFLFHNSERSEVVAFYPGPAGATESLLAVGIWTELREANPILATLLPDVEAILLYQRKDQLEAYLVPITKCYELTGVMRLHWKGFHGGAEAWQHIDAFFAKLAPLVVR